MRIRAGEAPGLSAAHNETRLGNVASKTLPSDQNMTGIGAGVVVGAVVVGVVVGVVVERLASLLVSLLVS